MSYGHGLAPVPRKEPSEASVVESNLRSPRGIRVDGPAFDSLGYTAAVGDFQALLLRQRVPQSLRTREHVGKAHPAITLYEEIKFFSTPKARLWHREHGAEVGAPKVVAEYWNQWSNCLD